METDKNILEQLLKEARNAPPFISADAMKQFVASHTDQRTIPTKPRKNIIFQRVIIAGGVMTAITAIVLIVGLYVNQQQAPQPAPSMQQAQRPSTIALADDSVKSVRTTEIGVPQQSSITQDAALDESHLSPKLTAASRKAQAAGYDSVLAMRRNELYGSWTKERIEACAVYDLDSLELSRIGIIVHSDSTISRSYGNFTISMKENMSDGSVVVRLPLGKPRSAADSIKLARAIEKSKLQPAPSIAEPIRPSGLVPVHEVLVTNSKGRTFSHSTSTGNPGTIAAIGSGDYTGEELIAIRVRFKRASASLESEDYYYIYWYEPTTTFLNLMPPRVRQAIERRAGTDSRIAQSEGVRSKGLDASSVFPNPVTQDVATLDYTLREASRVAVSVYDITGERVKNVAVTDQRDPGNWKETFSVAGIPDGYYLLAVTTDKGEQRIHPMVVKR